MLRRLALIGLAAVFVSSIGCSKDDEEPANPVPPSLTALPTTVPADGVASTTITVTAGAAPFTLVTSRGTFQNGETSVQVPTVGGSAVLTPCDADVTPACAGPTLVTAAGGDGGVNQVVVLFQGSEICNNAADDNLDGTVDCADLQCQLDTPCGPNGLVCSATRQCNKCSVPAGAVVDASGETHCEDGVDNDCDGQVDCADADCGDQSCTTQNGSIGVCDSGACVCDKTEQAEATCGDGRDNDCDTLVDCADPDCLGDVCDASRGLVCSGAPARSCTVCPTGLTAESAAQCGDGKDNDCDGDVDCFDSDCQPAGGAPGQACNPFGGRCILTSGVPSCGCPGGATNEASCTDGVDDDCDGAMDCTDDDCQPAGSGFTGPSCGPNGRACTSEGDCACPTGDVEICNNYDAGGAAIDDDCDGLANCLDRDCRPTTPGGEGADCSSPDQFGMSCDATGVCGCGGNGGTAEAAELTCGDGFDNDCDFLIDCQDPDCRGQTPARSCGPAGATCDAAVAQCVCPGGTTESACDDGVDNDCNGKTDCEEPLCAAQACSGSFPSYVCIAGACADPVSQYAVTLTPVRPRIPAAAGAATAVNVVVTRNGAAQPGLSVSFALSDPALGALGAGSATTDSLGRAQVTFTAAGPVGVETIEATVAGVGAKGNATVVMPAIGEIRLVAEGGVLFPVMGVRTSGFQEQNQLVIEVLDTERQLYPDGLDIVFEHRRLGGSTLSDPLAATPACPAADCVQSVVATNAIGAANVRLYSGTVAGVVRVSATAVAGGVTRLFELPSIAIVGAKPNAGHFSVVCTPENVPAYAGSTCHVSTIDAPFTCVALLKDRYNNVLGRATTVSFMSEAGAVGPPAVTPEYDPGAPPSEQGELGSAVELVNTLGAKLPKDVPSNLGEQDIGSTDVCGVTERSPRDGVATVVAWTPGEEAFFDENGNGLYDLGEPFVDLPEPFVDYDDDDVRDADEPFIDSNANLVFDGPNGAWDSNANVWTKTVVVYSGMPAFMRVGGQDYLARWMEPVDAGTYAAPTPIASFAVRPAFPPEPFTDCNDNERRDVAVVETFTDANTNGAYDGPEPLTDLNGNGIHDPGEPFVDTSGNGTWDAGEPFQDCNGDGVRQAVIAEPFSDLDQDGAYDQFGQPATSETLVVAAADRNLNRLAQGTSYEVTQPEGTTFDLSYNGEQLLPDRRGLGFAFQPCLANADHTPSATCALDCADISTVLNRRCVMRTRVADFTYGYTATVTFTGGAEGDRDGATSASWNMTLFNETLRVNVSGTHQ